MKARGGFLRGLGGSDHHDEGRWLTEAEADQELGVVHGAWRLLARGAQVASRSAGSEVYYRAADVNAQRAKVERLLPSWRVIPSMVGWRLTVVERDWLASPFALYECGLAPRPLGVVEEATCGSHDDHKPPHVLCACGVWATSTWAEAVDLVIPATGYAMEAGEAAPVFAIGRYELEEVAGLPGWVRARRARLIGPLYAGAGADIDGLARRYRVPVLKRDVVMTGATLVETRDNARQVAREKNRKAALA